LSEVKGIEKVLFFFQQFTEEGKVPKFHPALELVFLSHPGPWTTHSARFFPAWNELD
jgi:hypothetical protein